jgi:hypothetical protein
VRNIETIDSELRLLVSIRNMVRQLEGRIGAEGIGAEAAGVTPVAGAGVTATVGAGGVRRCPPISCASPGAWSP